MKTGTASFVMAIVGGFAATAIAQPWNAAADFSASTNPDGPWSYGTRALSNGSLLSLLSDSFGSGALVGWRDNANLVSGTPTVYRNFAIAPVIVGSVTAPANSLIMHPGPTGFGPGGTREYVVTRWTSPVNDLVSLVGSFDAADSGSTTIFIVHNGTTVFSSLRPSGGNVPFSGALSVAIGDTVDFVVGNNGSFSNDSTVLNVTIIPAPGAAALLGLGGVMAAATRRRR